MGKTKEIEPSNDKSPFGAVRCPNPACRRILFEMGRDFWIEMPEEVACPKCGKEAFPFFSFFTEEERGRLTVRYLCLLCQEEIDQRVPALRKYCSGCKTYQLIFFSPFSKLYPSQVGPTQKRNLPLPVFNVSNDWTRRG